MAILGFNKSTHTIKQLGLRFTRLDRFLLLCLGVFFENIIHDNSGNHHQTKDGCCRHQEDA